MSSIAYRLRVVTLEQIRAGRGLLGWSQKELSEKANVPLSAVKAVEGGKDVRVSVLTAIEQAFIDGGVMFQEPGDTRPGGRGARFRE